MVVQSLGKIWHREHFTCMNCQATIGIDCREFRASRTDKSRPLCLDCFMEAYHPKCHVCDKTLRETCVKAFDKLWHFTCFTCTKCRSPFARGEYYLLEGKPYDCDCYYLTKYENLLSPDRSQLLAEQSLGQGKYIS
ncbi:hypothetical protein AB6A40_011311 [Gnathostoma spinigerum]|uniref:LIM zinc-binding domain-containing protein n=1 Tax=Gnathostoma spinigerum TaxID=75299 RepID=A0ABD6F3W5_9BILA